MLPGQNPGSGTATWYFLRPAPLVLLKPFNQWANRIPQRLCGTGCSRLCFTFDVKFTLANITMPKKAKLYEIPYGPVWIAGGPHKGRIGIYDDNDYNIDRKCEEAIIYFGDFQIAPGYFIIPFENISAVTTHALMGRREELFDAVTSLKKSSLKGEKRARALEELHLIEGLLADRMFSARLTEVNQGARVFISHSSKDKQFARWIAVDLKNAGHRIWFDEWDIKVGESIPRKIGHGLDACDYVAVVLSKHAVESRWVENEWHAKYWDEIEKNKVMVLPVLKEGCTIPTLLKTKKYADFRSDYTQGLEDLMHALAHLNVDLECRSGPKVTHSN